MSGLPWVRLDSNIASHDKILRLLDRRGGKAIAFVYVCSLGYAGGNGTDGLIPFAALPFIHGSKRDAEALVEVGLWEPHPFGWLIHNYAERQQVAATTAAIRAAQRKGALKANCTRWHGPDCRCWDRPTLRAVEGGHR